MPELRHEIRRNSSGLNTQMIGSVIGITILYFLFVWLIRRPFEWFDAEPILGWFGIFMVYGLLIIGVLVGMQRSWAKRSYYLQGNMLIVVQKNPITNSVVEDIYRLDTVVSVSVAQGVLGKHYKFGDIKLMIPKLGKTESIVLKDINRPRESVIDMQKLIDSKHGGGLTVSS